jgi:hypothetical protein
MSKLLVTIPAVVVQLASSTVMGLLGGLLGGAGSCHARCTLGPFQIALRQPDEMENVIQI